VLNAKSVCVDQVELDDLLWGMRKLSCLFLSIALIACAEERVELYKNKNVAKIIRIRSYDSEVYFDSLSIRSTPGGIRTIFKNDDVFDTTSDWRNYYLDSDENLLCREYVFLNGDSIEEIRQRKVFEYDSLTNKISRIIDTRFGYADYQVEVTRFIRNNQLKITEVEKYRDDSLHLKQQNTYNTHNQRIGIMLYDAEGLVESTEYEYQSTHDEHPRKIVSFFPREFEVWTEHVKRDLDKKVIERRVIGKRGGDIISNEEIYYSQYREDIALKEIRIINAMRLSFMDSTSMKRRRTNINRAINAHGDVIKIVFTHEDIDKEGNVIDNNRTTSVAGLPMDTGMIMSKKEVKRQFEYNESGEWIKQITYDDQYISPIITLREFQLTDGVK
jgi:hypothetical protein